MDAPSVKQGVNDRFHIQTTQKDFKIFHCICHHSHTRYWKMYVLLLMLQQVLIVPNDSGSIICWGLLVTDNGIYFSHAPPNTPERGVNVTLKEHALKLSPVLIIVPF